jgi:probable rRNA maturation factor
MTAGVRDVWAGSADSGVSGPLLLNRQRAVRVSLKSLRGFAALAFSELSLQKASVTICLVSDAEIARMNEAFRKKKGPTDVLSFPAVVRRAPLPIHLVRTRPRHLGDIAISPAVARRNARSYARSLQQELQILILHGILHLCGYDHETDRGQMDRIENKLRRKLGLA